MPPRSDGPVLAAVAQFVFDAYGVEIHPETDSAQLPRRRLLEKLHTHYMTPRMSAESIRGKARAFIHETNYYEQSRAERARLRDELAKRHGFSKSQIGNALRQLEFSNLR